MSEMPGPVPQKERKPPRPGRVRKLPALPASGSELSPDMVSAIKLLIQYPAVLCMLRCMAAYHKHGCTLNDMEKFALQRGVYRKRKAILKPGLLTWAENRKWQLALRWIRQHGGVAVSRPPRTPHVFPSPNKPWTYRITDTGKMWLYAFDNVDLSDI